MKTLTDCDKEIRLVEVQPYLLRESLRRGDCMSPFKTSLRQTSLVVHWLRRCTSTAGGPVGSFVREISHAVWSSQKEKRKKEKQKTSLGLTSIRDRWSRCVLESHSVIGLLRWSGSILTVLSDLALSRGVLRSSKDEVLTVSLKSTG